MRVLAKAYKDRPLDRVIAERAGRVVFLATASALRANSATGVGFPLGCVFEFDDQLYEALTRAWEAGDSARVDELWSAAQPLGPMGGE